MNKETLISQCAYCHSVDLGNRLGRPEEIDQPNVQFSHGFLSDDCLQKAYPQFKEEFRNDLQYQKCPPLNEHGVLVVAPELISKSIADVIQLVTQKKKIVNTTSSKEALEKIRWTPVEYFSTIISYFDRIVPQQAFYAEEQKIMGHRTHVVIDKSGTLKDSENIITVKKIESLEDVMRQIGS